MVQYRCMGEKKDNTAMLVTIRPAPCGIGGVIAAPPSKSMAHRAVLCAALAVGRSHITHLEFSKDISATPVSYTHLTLPTIA